LISVLAGGAWLLRTGGTRALKNSVSGILFVYLAFWGFAALWWR